MFWICIVVHMVCGLYDIINCFTQYKSLYTLKYLAVFRTVGFIIDIFKLQKVIFKRLFLIFHLECFSFFHVWHLDPADCQTNMFQMFEWASVSKVEQQCIVLASWFDLLSSLFAKGLQWLKGVSVLPDFLHVQEKILLCMYLRLCSPRYFCNPSLYSCLSSCTLVGQMSAHPRSLLQSASNYLWPSDESRPLEWRYRGAGEDECGGLGFCTHCTCGSSPQRQQDWLWKACGGPHYLQPKLLLAHRAGAAWGLWPALSCPSEKYTRQSECRAEPTIKEEAIILAFLLKP